MKPNIYQETRKRGIQELLISSLLGFLMMSLGCAIPNAKSGSAGAPHANPESSIITPRSSVLLSATAEPETVIEPPAPVEKVFHFTNATLFTHWVLESSTNLVNWENRNEITVLSDDGTNSSLVLTNNTFKPNEFYRVAGDTI